MTDLVAYGRQVHQRQWLSRVHPALVITGVAVLGVMLASDSAHAQQGAQQMADPPVLDGIAQTFRTAALTWRPRLIPLAQRTFALLAALEFAVSGIEAAFRRDGMDAIAAKFLLKFTLISVLLTLITTFDFWVPPIINGFVAAGETVVGRGVVSPSDIIDLGRETTMTVLSGISLTALWHDPAMALFAALCAFAIGILFAMVAVLLLLLMLEISVVVLGAGVLFCGFGSSRWTAGLTDGFLNYTVYVGVRVFLMYLVIGLGMTVARSWIPLIQNSHFTGTASPLLEVVGGALAFAVMTYRIPNTIASRLTSHHTFGLAHAYRALNS